jgi:hypothetical protein
MPAASATALTWYWLWHPLIGVGYQFWSGIASDIGEVTLIGGMIAIYRKHNCGAPRCLRLGKHPTADGLHHLCAKHHPDLPDSGHESLEQIHARHRAAKRMPLPKGPDV